MMICGFFSVFWFSFGLLELPTMGFAASYSATGNAAEGAASVGYNSGIALYLIALGCTLFTFFIFTLRTNVVLAIIIGLATVAIWILSGAYFKVSSGDFGMASQLQKVLSHLFHHNPLRTSIVLGFLLFFFFFFPFC
jgi:hypothetical protein